MATVTTTVTMEKFVQDIRDVFASTGDPREQAQRVAAHMQEALRVPGWLEEAINLPPEEGYGRVDLHQDEEYGHPGPGFLLMCSVQHPGQDNWPHDHGSSWVVYGVYEGAIEQVKWGWVYDEGKWTTPHLERYQDYVENPGDVAFFLPGEIHNTRNVNEGRSVVVRVEGQELSRVPRHRYNPETGEASLY